MKTRLLTLLVVLAVWFLGGSRSEQAWGGVVRLEVLSLSDAERLDRFEVQLEQLRQQMGIPALSAAIVKDQRLIWAQGFGSADPRRKVEAGPDTPYHLASLTKPIAAVIVMQLVEEGKLGLDDPVSKFGIEIDSPGIVRVRNLLNHTSAGIPGSNFEYDGGRFELLTFVIEQASGRTLRELMHERILEPLALSGTATNPWGSEGFSASLGFVLGDSGTRRVYRELAEPYHLDNRYQPVHGGGYVEAFSAAAGLISTVEDMAAFDIALDQGFLVNPETRALMFSPSISTLGSKLPYGLGWFVQDYDHARLLWHYGYWYCASSLILKVPEEDLTLIVLANSEELSRPYKLGHKRTLVLNSPVALAFYETFIFEPDHGIDIPTIDWEAGTTALLEQLKPHVDTPVAEMLERELWSYRMLFGATGRLEQAHRLLQVHEEVFPNSYLGRDEVLKALQTEPPQPLTYPGLRHVIIAAACALVFVSILLLWPAGTLVQHLRARRTGASLRTPAERNLCRAACGLAILVAVLFLVIFFLAVVHYSTRGAPPVWADGPPAVKALLALPWVYILLVSILLALGAVAWRRRAGSPGWRVQLTVIAATSVVCVYLWQQLALLG